MKIFLNRLIYLRAEKSIGQKEFSKVIGINFETYRNYEKGLCKPNIKTLIKIAEFYHISLNYLVGRSEERGEFHEPDLSLFPQRVIELRRESGMTQPIIAEKIGVGKSGYKCYEMGKSIPPLDRLVALADVFGVSLDYLVGGKK